MARSAVRVPKRPGGRLHSMTTTVTSPECTPAHVSPSALGCRLRMPPEAEGAQTITIEEYQAWDAEDVARRRPTCVEGVTPVV